MTTYAFPSVTPSSSTWSLQSNTALFQSAFTGATETLDRGGEHWRVKLMYRNITAADKAVMQAWVVRLNGQQHRFTLHDHALTQRGAFGGTPLVAGASQTGSTLSVDGVSNVTNWIRAGDMFEVDGALKMQTIDATSSGAAVTLTFVPRIVTGPPNNEPIVTSSPSGLFMLANPVVQWSNAPNDLCNLSFDAIEDIAT